MEQYIPKSALIAEIERLKKSHDNWSCTGKCFHKDYETLLSFINALEVKENNTKCIDKDAIIAEIKGLMRANELYLSEDDTDEIRFQKVGAYGVLNDLLHFLETLEVKDMDLEKECSKYFEDNDGLCVHDDYIKFAKHFFELGLKAQKGE